LGEAGEAKKKAAKLATCNLYKNKVDFKLTATVPYVSLIRSATAFSCCTRGESCAGQND